MQATSGRGRPGAVLAATVIVALSVVQVSAAWAACPGPKEQLGCGDGALVSPSCAVAVYLPQAVQPSELVVKRASAGSADAGSKDAGSADAGSADAGAGGIVAITVTGPEAVQATGHDPFYIPGSCAIDPGVFYQTYQKYRVSAPAGWPLGVSLQVTAAGAAVGAFQASASGTCVDATPTVGMCGSGWPAPIPGCPKSALPEDDGGCAVARGSRGDGALAALAVLAALLCCLRVRLAPKGRGR